MGFSFIFSPAHYLDFTSAVVTRNSASVVKYRKIFTLSAQILKYKAKTAILFGDKNGKFIQIAIPVTVFLERLDFNLVLNWERLCCLHFYSPCSRVSCGSYACLTQWENCTVSGVPIGASRTIIGYPLVALPWQSEPYLTFSNEAACRISAPPKFCTRPVAVTPSRVQHWHSAIFLSNQKLTA